MATDHRANNFNLIRLTLASAVILAHSPEIIDGDRHRELAAMIFGQWTSLGDLAVDGFFVLSGYLIAQSWLSSPHVLEYLGKRVLRIYPGFVVAGFISGYFLGRLGTNPNYGADLSRRLLAIGLAKLTLSVPTAFPDLPYPVINGPVWTIQYEFMCYLTLMLLGVVGILANRIYIASLAALVTCWAALQAGGLVPAFKPYHLVQHEDAQIPRLLSCFLAGATFYLLRDKIRPNHLGCLPAALLLGLGLFHPVSGTILIPWLGGYLLLAAGVASVVPWTDWVRRNDISYGLYLYAWPVQILSVAHLGIRIPWLLSLISVAVAAPAGWVSWQTIEKRALQLKKFLPAAG